MEPRTHSKWNGSTLFFVGLVVVGFGVVFVAIPLATFWQHRRVRPLPARFETRLKVSRVLDAVRDWRDDAAMDDKVGRRCPSSLHELVPSYVNAGVLKDGWGYELNISCRGHKVCVWSSGRNHRDEKGSGDDIQICFDGQKSP